VTLRCLLVATCFGIVAFLQHANAQPLIKEHFGVTSTLTVPLDKMDEIKVVRTYTSAGTFCKEPEEYMFEPTWQNFHYDQTLEDAKTRGIKFVLCITNNMPYYANGYTENENHPVPSGSSKTDPASYVMYAKLFFQIAARYGSKTVPDSLLKIKSYPATDYRHQTKRSGTDLVYGIELWNEANKWGGNFTPQEYYAMLSACYDGHKGTLGIGTGVMAADPDMHFLFTGTSDHTPAYHTQVRDIWVQERGEPFPENIIYNFHGYFHNKAINNNTRTTGIEPELGGALNIYRTWQTFAGNNKIAKTEYGYDTNPASVQHAPLLSLPDSGMYNIHESQAGLILRDYHLQSVIPNFFLSTFYHVRDGNNGGSTIQYSTSGITKGTCCNYDPKESYFIIAGFIEIAGDYFSNGTLLREDDPYIVEYRDAQGNYLYAVWTYIPHQFTINDVITADDTVDVIMATKNGNVYSSIVPVNGLFNVEAQQMPTYLKTNKRIHFNLAIAGTITTETGVPVPGVKVKLSGSRADEMVTTKNGVYAFAADSNASYVVTPSKNNDITINNGITSLDISLIRRHLLGSTPLNSPYKIIAADVNASQSITTVDVTLIRSVILGKTSYPSGKLWEFVNSSEALSPANPFPFTRIRAFNNITETKINQNFIGVKLGDVNNSWESSIP